MTKTYIVEPQQLTRTGLVAVLGAEADITVCGSSESVSAAAHDIVATQPDLLLIDLPALGNSAYRFVQQIKESLHDTKIVIFTSCAEEESVCTCMQLGVEAYLLKGCSITLLSSAIKAVGAGATWLDPVVAKRAFAKAAQDHAASKKTIALLNPLLSPRENEVVALLAEGFCNREIADRLVVSTETVKTHVRHIMEKMNAHSRTDAAIKALQAGPLRQPAIGAR